MINPKRLLFISLILVSSGLLVATPAGIAWLQQQQALAATPTIIQATPKIAADPSAATIEGIPVHISIPSVGVDTNVSNGTYDSRTATWTLNESSAFFASVTNPANTIGGNTFIYGHDSEKIFGKLRSIQANAVAILTTDNGYLFTYTFMSTQKVQPSDVDVLNYTGSPARLTLQTCPGEPNLTRQIFYFRLTSYDKI